MLLVDIFCFLMISKFFTL